MLVVTIGVILRMYLRVVKTDAIRYLTSPRDNQAPLFGKRVCDVFEESSAFQTRSQRGKAVMNMQFTMSGLYSFVFVCLFAQCHSASYSPHPKRNLADLVVDG